MGRRHRRTKSINRCRPPGPTPTLNADIAEILIDAGRRDEAAALYKQLRQRDPDDVWLDNSAAYSDFYTGIDDDLALRWVLDGIDVAIATGDGVGLQAVGSVRNIGRR